MAASRKLPFLKTTGMTLKDIDDSFDHSFPHEALPEVLKVAAEATNSIHVAA